MDEPTRPTDVGILAMEVYFPPSYIPQVDLEVFDKVSTGKYTIGLGQDAMVFCCDNEDVISMSLTVVERLLEKNDVDPAAVGRLDVGSETVIDKSKSIKSALMPIFEAAGNTDIEGVDSTNACYGGTAALFNALNWVESASWDGRYALVVAADSAVYAAGPARPTGGAGAVAMLIGPGAPLALERQLNATHAQHVYDFYKPKLASEYAVVDGKLTQVCYLRAVDKCYGGYCSKFEKHTGEVFTLDKADFVAFHAPYNKLVQKSFARLVYDDFRRCGRASSEDAAGLLQPFLGLPQEDSYTDRTLEKAAMQAASKEYAAKVGPTTTLPKASGNSYCASLYTSLASLLGGSAASHLEGRRVLLFSYGSGVVASMFSLVARPGGGRGGDEKFTLDRLRASADVHGLLDGRRKVSPEEFAETMELMETRYGACDFYPLASAELLQPGAYYLTHVDALYRRTYKRKAAAAAAGGAGGEAAAAPPPRPAALANGHEPSAHVRNTP